MELYKYTYKSLLYLLDRTHVEIGQFSCILQYGPPNPKTLFLRALFQDTEI